MAIEGPLRELSIHDVFQLLDLSRKTGALKVRSEIRLNAGTVYFERGGVVGAEIRSNPHPLGGLLLRAGKLSEEDLTRARAMQENGDGRKLGEILVSIGAISRRQLERRVRGQVEEVVFELLSWSEGYFSFEEGDPGELPTEADIRIPTEALLMEAARRIDEWSRIETRIPHLGIIPRLAQGNDSRLDLIPFEWEVLAMVDGRQDVRDLSQHLRRSEFEVAKTLFGLASTGILMLEDPVSRPAEPPGGRELAMLIARAEDELLRGQPETARRLAEEAVARHPDEPLAHAAVGRAHLAEGHHQEATAALQRALQLDLQCVPALRLLGYSLVARGLFLEAVESWDRWSAMPDLSPEEAAHSLEVRSAREAAYTLERALRGGRE